MIIDLIEYAHLYQSLSKRISKALEYIKQTDLKNLQPGKYDIDGENIFALVSEYETKLESEGKPEAHRKYIDVQYVISGEERMGYAPLNKQEILEPYKNENDIIFYKGENHLSGSCRIDEGMFAIFFPTDVHMPGINTGRTSHVKKLVIKVRTD